MALLGKADPTLVKGAYAVAAANIPGDMSEIYKQREANIKTLTEGIQKAWDSQFEAYNALEASITEQSDVAYQNTLEGKTNDSMLAAVDAEVRAIKAEMQTFDKRDKGNLEWKKLEARIGKLVTTTKNNDATWSTLIDLSKNEDLLIAGIKPGDLKLYEAMIYDYNNNKNTTGTELVDGDFVYRLFDENGQVTHSMTMSDLKRNLKIKDDTAPNGITTTINGVMKTASTTNRKWDDTYQADTRNSIRNNLKSANDRTNVIHHRFVGMKFSFFEALTGKDPVMQEQIFDALDGVSTAGLDVNKDGIKDSEMVNGVPNFDYTTPDNAVALQKAIINSANSKDLIANFLTENIGANAYNIGDKLHAKTSTVKTGTDKEIILNPDVDRIQKIVSNQTIDLPDFRLLNLNGGWVKYSDDGKSFVFHNNKGQVIDTVSMDNREGIRLALYDLTDIDTGERVDTDITVTAGMPTKKDIKKAEAIQLLQKQYEDEQNKLLRAPNRESTKKKIEQIFNTSEGNYFTANNPGNVTKAFTNSTYADMGMKFKYIEKDSGEWVAEDQLEFNEEAWMRVDYGREAYYFDTESSNFQSEFQKWFLEVVDPQDVAAFNQLSE